MYGNIVQDNRICRYTNIYIHRRTLLSSLMLLFLLSLFVVVPTGPLRHPKVFNNFFWYSQSLCTSYARDFLLSSFPISRGFLHIHHGHPESMGHESLRRTLVPKNPQILWDVSKKVWTSCHRKLSCPRFVLSQRQNRHCHANVL